MQLIDYTPEWFGPVTRLFYESVHRSGGAAYSPEELEAWAPREMDFSSWEISLVRSTVCWPWTTGESSAALGISMQRAATWTGCMSEATASGRGWQGPSVTGWNSWRWIPAAGPSVWMPPAWRVRSSSGVDTGW